MVNIANILTAVKAVSIHCKFVLTCTRTTHKVARSCSPYCCGAQTSKQSTAAEQMDEVSTDTKAQTETA